MVFGVDALRFLESVLEVTIRQAASMGVPRSTSSRAPAAMRS